eukprot:gene6048-4343_t
MLSGTIKKLDDDGDFQWATAVWLTYHEAFRRELARAVRAFDRFDPVEDAWKAIAMYRWLGEFLLPVLQHHERGKQLFTKPFYASKGHTIPDSLNYSETFVLEPAARIMQLAKECMQLAMSDNLFPKKIREAALALETEVGALSSVLNAHYDAEEVFWPRVFEAEGLDVWNILLHKMLTFNRRHSARISNHTFAMVFHAIGYNLKNLSAEDPLDRPWCGPKMRFVFVKKAPFIVKALPLVKWMHDYLRYKNMVNSIYVGHEDILDHERRYRAEEQRLARRQAQGDQWTRWLRPLFGARRNAYGLASSPKAGGVSDTATPTVPTLSLSAAAGGGCVGFCDPELYAGDDSGSARSHRSTRLVQQPSIVFAPQFHQALAAADDDVVSFDVAFKGDATPSESPKHAKERRDSNAAPSPKAAAAAVALVDADSADPQRRRFSLWPLALFSTRSGGSSSSSAVGTPTTAAAAAAAERSVLSGADATAPIGRAGSTSSATVALSPGRDASLSPGPEQPETHSAKRSDSVTAADARLAAASADAADAELDRAFNGGKVVTKKPLAPVEPKATSALPLGPAGKVAPSSGGVALASGR